MAVASDLAAAVALWDQTGDFATYCEALGQMFVEVESYAEDTDTVIGWQPLWDYNTAPSNALPWLCMAAGEIAPQGATDAQLRTLIQTNPNAYRGGPQAIVDAVKACLTGSQLVGFAERQKQDGTADDDWISVFTYQSQTPNQNAVLSALRRTVPADINYAYQCLAGPTWASLEAGVSNGTWTQLYAKYGTTWAQIESATPGYVIYA